MDSVRLRSRNGKVGMSIQPQDGPEGKADAKELQRILEALSTVDVFSETPASTKISPTSQKPTTTGDS